MGDCLNTTSPDSSPADLPLYMSPYMKYLPQVYARGRPVLAPKCSISWRGGFSLFWNLSALQELCRAKTQICGMILVSTSCISFISVVLTACVSFWALLSLLNEAWCDKVSLSRVVYSVAVFGAGTIEPYFLSSSFASSRSIFESLNDLSSNLANL